MVDTKKKMIWEFKNNGLEWNKKGEPIKTKKEKIDEKGIKIRKKELKIPGEFNQ